MTIGHEKIWEFFDNAIIGGNLSHAYCFVGLGQLGKRTLAKQIGARLLGVAEDKLASHPDYYYLERVEDEKTGKLKKEISIAQARDLRSRTLGKTWSGGYRIVIIDEAELLNEESSNALLKTIEEPGAKTIFFLLTENDNAILPTIRSRCEKLFFNLVPDETICAGLVSRGVSAKNAEEVTGIAWGRPGRAIDFFLDKDLKEKYLEETARWKSMIGRPFHEKLKSIESLFGDKSEHTDHIRERGKLQKILDIWIMLWRDVLLAKTGAVKKMSSGIGDPGDVKNISAENILEIINELQTARKLLGQNIHPKLLIEQILLKF